MRLPLFALLALSVGCVVDAPSAGTPSLALELAAPSGPAGEAVTYEARLVWADGTTEPTTATLTSDLEPGLAVTADAFTPTLAGHHTLSASATADGTQLAANAAFDVTAGATTALTLTLDAATTLPTVPVGFVLSGQDAFGNAADLSTATVTADGGLVVGADTVSGTAAGDWTVSAVSGAATATAPLHIDHGEPAEIALDLVVTNQEIGTTVTVSDAWGNPIPEAAYTLTAEGGPYTVVGTSVYLTDDGVYYVSATVDGTDVSVTEGPIVVDSAPPILTVTTPERSTWGDVGSATIAGTVTDGLAGVASLTVNGTEAPRVGADWSLDTSWNFGINILETEATDAVGNHDHDVRAVLAGELLPSGDALDDGVLVRLNEGAGGLDALAEAAGDPVDPDAVLAALPVPLYAKSTTVPFVGTYSISLTIDALAWSSSALTLDPQSDGTLHATLTLTDFEADWTATTKSPSSATSTGTATASSVSVEMVLTMNAVDGEIQVDVTDVTVDISADLDVGLPSSTTTLLSVLGVSIESELETAFSDAASDEFAADVAAEVEAQLADLAVVKSWVLGDTSAVLTATPASIAIDDTGLTLGYATRIVLDGWMIDAPDLGSPVYGYATPTWSATPGTQMAFSADFVNQVFYSAWGAGALGFEKTDEELTIEMSTFSTALPGITDLVAVTAPTLPPVVVPNPGGDLSFVVGDYSMSLYDGVATPGTEVYRVFLDASTPMEFGLTGGALDTTLGTPDFWADVDQMPVGADAATLEGYLEFMGPALHLNGTRLVGDIPIPDLAGYELAGATVDMGGADLGYVVIGGDLTAP